MNGQQLVLLVVMAIIGGLVWRERQVLGSVVAGARRVLGVVGIGPRGVSAVHELAGEIVARLAPELDLAVRTGATPPTEVAVVEPVDSALPLVEEAPAVTQEVCRQVTERLRLKAEQIGRACAEPGSRRRLDGVLMHVRIYPAEVAERFIVTGHTAAAAKMRAEQLVGAARGGMGEPNVVVDIPDTPAELVDVAAGAPRRTPRTILVGGGSSGTSGARTQPAAGAVSVSLGIEGSATVASVWLRSGAVVTVGRDATCDLVVPEACGWVSATHLALRRVGGEVEVRETSRNGTWLLAAQGRAARRVLDGQRIAVTSRLGLDEAGRAVVTVHAGGNR